MTEASLRQARILMVDDQVANTALLQSILGRIGYTNLHCLHDSREVLAHVRETEPDLIILDIGMPYLDGFQVIQQLGSLIPADRYLPILVLTADVTPVTKRKALAGGATDLLHKPFDASEIFMRIRNLLQTRFLHLETQSQNTLLEARVQERTAELAAALEELKQTQRTVVQQERLRAFGEMAGGVVHDFNNSLMSIIGYSDLLLHDPKTLEDRETTLDYLKVLNTAGRDAAQVVSRLRDFYREREFEDVFSALDLNEVIEESAALTQPKWKTHALQSGRSISVEFELQKLPLVSGNASELREAITNLILNAVDAMPAGGVITLRSRPQRGDVVFELSDTGTGMSDAVRTRCLEPFFSTKGDNGTGLGLSMVFGIIKRHNGTLEIESEPGKGTTMRILLPGAMKQADAPLQDLTRLDRSLRVLVVDDDAVPRDVVSKYLMADGHQVVTATNGAEAIAKFTEHRFDLLLTDHAMAGMNGLQLVAAVKELGGNQPIIVMTGSTEVAAVLEENGSVNKVLRKPIPQQCLRQALCEVLQIPAQAA